jgi:hypothetical protein
MPGLQKPPETFMLPLGKVEKGTIVYRKAIYGIQLQSNCKILSFDTIHMSSIVDMVLFYICLLERDRLSSFIVLRGVAFSRKSKGGAGTVLALTEPHP